jgi:hypothetical protein
MEDWQNDPVVSAGAQDYKNDPVVGITPDWQNDPVVSQGDVSVGQLEDVNSTAMQPMTPDEQSRTGQIGYEPSEVTGGAEPTKASEALRANIQPMLEHPIDSVTGMFTNWDDLKHLYQQPQDIAGPTLKHALGMPVAPEEEIGSQNFYNTGVGAALLAGGIKEGLPIEDIRKALSPEDIKPAEQPTEAPANAPESPVSRSDTQAVSTPPEAPRTAPVDVAPEANETTPDEFRPTPDRESRPMDEPSGQQQANQEPESGMGASRTPEDGGAVGEEPSAGVSTKNAYTDSQRSERGFPEATQEARRDFGAVWDEAEETARRDPGAGTRLVEAINDGKTKALSDTDNALLLREQIRAQGEHTDAVQAVNEAATPEDLTAAKARLTVARDTLQNVYDADRKAGRSTGQGLNARKMLATEDYSLAQMEARARAANDGKPLDPARLKSVQDLHDRIAALSDKVDELQKAREIRVGIGDIIKKDKVEARKAATSKRSFTDFTGEKAAAARERIAQRRAEGRLYAGVDPTAVADHVIIGADYIAKGVTKFSDWSAAMVKELGEKIRPFLQDLYAKARNYHDQTSKAYRTPEEVNLARYKTRMAQDTAGYTAKIQRGDFVKPTRESMKLDPAAFKMKANLQKLKNEFERGVAKDSYRNMSPADKFWQHFVGVERAMKLSSPAVFEKLGTAAAVREFLSPAESAVGYGASKVFPKLAEGTRYGADLKTLTRAEWKAKASLFTQGIRDAAQNLKGKETDIEAMSDKYGRQPDFWYNRIGKLHAAIKAPIKRAEFERSLALKMDAATKAGEDINHPEVMDRLATESALEGNRAIFQQNTVVSKLFANLEKSSPAAGRVARFVFPVVKIPVNLFKELVTYHTGAPIAATRIGMAYWKGIGSLEPAYREAIIRQFAKGSVGGAALIYGYANRDNVRDFFKSVPSWFEHTPVAMAIHEGSLIADLQDQGTGTKFRPTQAWKDTSRFSKNSIPFAYTVTGLTNALDPTNPNGWRDYLYGMLQGSVVPQAASWTAKEMDKPTPFNPLDKPNFRPPQNIRQAITQGIPGMREEVPIKQYKH